MFVKLQQELCLVLYKGKGAVAVLLLLGQSIMPGKRISATK
jgi:hypothetical protein